ncbi:hypothetical protein HanIR_Chr10g0461271 [Helianthus annuus]|nr:hypothetical protein HanIR_Chr10g0461271 [Helianthus annuus]
MLDLRVPISYLTIHIDKYIKLRSTISYTSSSVSISFLIIHNDKYINLRSTISYSSSR